MQRQSGKAFMKKLILGVIGIGIVAGLGFYVNRRELQPVLQPVAENVAAPAGEERVMEPAAAASKRRAQSTQTAEPASPSSRPTPARPNSVIDASLVNRAVDLLVSPQANYEQKREAWKQLRETGKLDLAIAELEQRMANDPRVSEYPAALGQAYLKKCGTIQDMREQGILAMQADKVFDTALSLDASNWEARFTKAVGMSYWPPVLNKGEEVIQQFQTLIQQQEAQAPQSHFANTYAWLGEQYQKSGRTDDARAVWRRGAALFPADETLRARLASTQ
jgi:tetratricopeptide (TPR) repeat protein